MPLRSDWSQRFCPIARSLDVVGDPWALLILRQALSGAHRFEDFRAGVGAADNVLSSRLRTLVEDGLLRREPYTAGTRTREGYALTPAGADMLPVLNALAIWGETHRPHSDPAVQMHVVHRDCGHVTATSDTCSHCGDQLSPTSTLWRTSWTGSDVALTAGS